MPSSPEKLEMMWVLTRFDDIDEKLTVMSVWEAVVDDARNPESDMDEKISAFLKPGKKYRLTITVEEM